MRIVVVQQTWIKVLIPTTFFEKHVAKKSEQPTENDYKGDVQERIHRNKNLWIQGYKTRILYVAHP